MAYTISCADCHGIDGKGNGPIAASLEAKPTDLTVEAKNNNGEFPFEAVYDMIDGRKPIAASTSRHVPIWGQAFLSFGPDSQGIPRNRISAIIDYLKRIQASRLSRLVFGIDRDGLRRFVAIARTCSEIRNEGGPALGNQGRSVPLSSRS
jgi:hypothetical protein